MKMNVLTLVLLFLCLGANAQLCSRNSRDFVDLTPDESILYKYVHALDEGSQTSINELYESMKETDDQSILRRNEGGWYVKKDYPLPDGNYYESFFYNKDSKKTWDAVFIIYPVIQLYVNNSGQISDLLEILGDKVSVEDMWSDLVGGTDCRLKCNKMKTSEEVLEMVDYVCGLNIQGLAYFLPRKSMIDRSDNTYLINILTGQEPVYENGLRVIAGVDWTVQGLTGCVGEGESPYYTVEGVGLIINSNPADGAAYWEPMAPMIGHIPELKKGGHYLVKFTIDTPAAGEIRLDFCSWDGTEGATMAQIINVEAGENEYTVDFLDYPTDCTDGMIFYQCGHLPGQHIIKKVQVFKIEGANGRNHEGTAIGATKAVKADNAIYNLAGQKVSTSYKGFVIKNGKKFLQK